MDTTDCGIQGCSAEGRQLEEGMRQAPGECYPAEQATGRPFSLRARREAAIAENAVPA